MRKFQEMCQVEFEKVELMARGGQKIVFDGIHNSYGEIVIKLNCIFNLTIQDLLEKLK